MNTSFLLSLVGMLFFASLSNAQIIAGESQSSDIFINHNIHLESDDNNFEPTAEFDVSGDAINDFQVHLKKGYPGIDLPNQLNIHALDSNIRICAMPVGFASLGWRNPNAYAEGEQLNCVTPYVLEGDTNYIIAKGATITSGPIGEQALDSAYFYWNHEITGEEGWLHLSYFIYEPLNWVDIHASNLTGPNGLFEQHYTHAQELWTAYISNGLLHYKTTKPPAKVDVFDSSGRQLLSIKKPNSPINLSNIGASVIVRMTMADGDVSSKTITIF